MKYNEYSEEEYDNLYDMYFNLYNDFEGVPYYKTSSKERYLKRRSTSNPRWQVIDFIIDYDIYEVWDLITSLRSTNENLANYAMDNILIFDTLLESRKESEGIGGGWL